MKDIIVTTSWDDGAVEDIRLLELLNKYNLRGTFYIPKKIDFQIKPGKKMIRISDEKIKKIAQTQEIGGHSLSHVYFEKLSNQEIKEEIIGSKKYLEDLLDKKVLMFCYPGGVYNKKTIEYIKDAGFFGARTSKLFKFNIENPFAMGTTINCYPFPFRKDSLRAAFQPLLSRGKDISRLGLPLKSFFGWKKLAESLFEHTLQNGGIFHLWGHSWEIEKNKMWKDIESIFLYISRRPAVKYLTNSETIKNL